MSARWNATLYYAEWATPTGTVLEEMGTGRAQFIGAAGQYYVAYGFSVREIAASLTIRNSPGVDILVSPDGGLTSLSIQVKTSRNAYRSNRYGHEGFEWDVGSSSIGKWSPFYWYAFVDLQEKKEDTPIVFFVPSKWVAEFIKPSWGRFVYFLPKSAESLCFEKWENIPKLLRGEKEIVEMAET